MASLEKYQKYRVLAILCLVYSGIALVLFTNHAHFLVEGTEPRLRGADMMNNGTNSSANGMRELARATIERENHRPELITQISFNLVGALVSLLAGIALLRIVRAKETKEVKKEVVAAMVLPDEKTVILELKANDGELTQSDIVKKTGLSKVKVHRVVKRLETLGVIVKYPYGMTNKIKLEKDVFEE